MAGEVHFWCPCPALCSRLVSMACCVCLYIFQVSPKYPCSSSDTTGVFHQARLCMFGRSCALIGVCAGPWGPSSISSHARDAWRTLTTIFWQTARLPGTPPHHDVRAALCR
jgi:hypothetical protein